MVLLVYNGTMEILKEITIWDCGYNVPNNTYLLNKVGKLVAYIKAGDTVINELKTPLEFSKSRRKFIKIQHDGLSKLITDDKHNTKRIIPKNIKLYNVASKDKNYIVEVSDSLHFSCNCTGFGFRRKCKHVDAVKDSL